MYPDNKLSQSPGQPAPQVYGPAQPTPPQPGQVPPAPAPVPAASGKPGRSKLFYVLIAAAVLVILMLVGAVVISAASPKKKQTTTSQSTAQTTAITPATSLSVQQGIDAINQNISSLNDTNDFPANALSDSTLSHN